MKKGRTPVPLPITEEETLSPTQFLRYVEKKMSARGGPRLGHPWPSKDRKYSTRWDRTIDTNTS